MLAQGKTSDPTSATLEDRSTAAVSQDYPGLRDNCRSLYRAKLTVHLSESQATTRGATTRQS